MFLRREEKKSQVSVDCRITSEHLKSKSKIKTWRLTKLEARRFQFHVKTQRAFKFTKHQKVKFAMFLDSEDFTYYFQRGCETLRPPNEPKSDEKSEAVEPPKNKMGFAKCS